MRAILGGIFARKGAKRGTAVENVRARILFRLLRTSLGLAIFAFGVLLTIEANIGLAPWDAFSMGLSFHMPISYGTAHIAISCLILFIDLLMREKIGYGTVLDALLVGLFVDIYTRLDFVPRLENLPGGIAMMAVGLFIMSFGQYIYMSAAQGCGPRDALFVALGRKFPRAPIGLVNICLQGAVLLCGYLLGAPVGVGTVISAFGCGISMQIVFRLLRFEPRDTAHQGIFSATRALVRGGQVDLS